MKKTLSLVCTSMACVVGLAVSSAQAPPAPAATSAAPPPQVAQQSPASASPLGDAAAGSHTFMSNCSGCHGSDGRGGERAPNIATNRQVSAMSDDDLINLVKKGVAGSGMPPFAYLGDGGVKDVVAHLRVLQGKNIVSKVNGDAAAGRTLFYGKAQCSQCHAVKGEGGYIGTDLTDYAAGIKSEDIGLAITQPDKRLAPTSVVADVLLLNGTKVSGVVRAEDNFSITLQTIDGGWHTYDKARLASMKHTGHSLHPRDYDAKLSKKEVDDLVSYLVLSSAGAPPKPGHRRGGN